MEWTGRVGLCRVQVEVIMPRVYVHTERSVVTSKTTYNVTSCIGRIWFTVHSYSGICTVEASIYIWVMISLICKVAQRESAQPRNRSPHPLEVWLT